MNERSIVITEKDGTYQIHNSLLNEYELLGLLEQIIFDLKYSGQGKSRARNTSEQKVTDEALSNVTEPSPDSKVDVIATGTNEVTKTTKAKTSSTAPSSVALELRTRIGNAIKAIRDLGGKIEPTELSQMSDEELQTELEELTAQYKLLKNSKGK